MAKKQEKAEEGISRRTISIRCLSGTIIGDATYECGEVYEVSPAEAQALLGTRFELAKG